MALHTVRTDDITGEPEAQTVVVTVNGKGIEVDLAAKSLDRLVKALEPFWKVGSESDYHVTRRLRPSRAKGARSNGTTPAASPSTSATETTAEERAAIREWAAANGLTAPSRGRMPQDLVEQYRQR